MEKKRTPRLRFRGFTDDWEQRNLGNFGKATGGTSIESEFSEDGIYKVINIGSYSENSIYNDQGIRAIKSDKTSNHVLNRNDLTMILNDKTTSGNIIGRVLLIEESGIYVYNQRTERIEIDLDEYDPVFLYEMLNAPNIREKIIKQAQGNTQIYVNWTAISLLEYMIPSKEEQAKIGEYLHSISNLITLHQRKYDMLKKVKKAMLEKMFPKNGKRVPEIRFAGFTDDWEQRKLGDIAKFINGRAYAQNELLPSGKYKVLRVGNFYTNDSWYYSDLKLDDKYYANDGDLLYTWSATFGPRIWRGDRVIYHYHIWKIDLTDELEKHFAVQLLEQDKNDILSGHNGSTMAHITKEGMEQKKVIIPKNIGEQRQLGLFFDNLDNLITLHQRKLEKLNKLKKSMLEEIFV
ncbi:restriction endonuclease subunit S [Eubacterium pyruvativorans]|uniref:restriction endonuclease subunit S n=1 Tax=Eubacterium pyruvativorans TaxID=155865 RepID=UPI003F8B12DA